MIAPDLQQSLTTLHAQQDAQAATLRALTGEVDALLGERRAIAEVLATFYCAPLSMSSVQPVLTLAERLDPSLVRR